MKAAISSESETFTIINQDYKETKNNFIFLTSDKIKNNESFNKSSLHVSNVDITELMRTKKQIEVLAISKRKDLSILDQMNEFNQALKHLAILNVDLRVADSVQTFRENTLSSLKNLESLKISKCHITDKILNELFKYWSHGNLENLDLSNNLLTYEVIDILSKIPSFKAIKRLNLSQNYIYPEKALDIIKIFTKLESLDISLQYAHTEKIKYLEDNLPKYSNCRINLVGLQLKRIPKISNFIIGSIVEKSLAFTAYLRTVAETCFKNSKILKFDDSEQYFEDQCYKIKIKRETIKSDPRKEDTHVMILQSDVREYIKYYRSKLVNSHIFYRIYHL